MSYWNNIGELATAAQLTGLDSVKLIALIVKAAKNARMHKKNCKQFAQHLNLIGNLLEQLKLSDLKEWPETREPLEELEEALKKAFVLINSCKDKSYLYLLALGWTMVSQFKERQEEIDRLLRLIPLITLVGNNRDRLRAIEKDHRVYTLDEEELKVHETILKPEVTKSDTHLLEKSLSRSYPGLSFDEALKKENNKLRMELHHMEETMEMDQVDVIHHLIDVTESVFPQTSTVPHSSSKSKRSKQFEIGRGVIMETCQEGSNDYLNTLEQSEGYTDTIEQSKPMHFAESGPPSPRRISLSLEQEPSERKTSHNLESWHSSLYDCCMDPYLCISTCMYPCGTFSDIAAFASEGKVSPEDACNDLMTYSLVLSCFCYTCCFRRKLRKRYNIQGGCCGDFCAHACCFYCALVQEWQEILARDGETSKMSPPPSQKMDREK